MTVVIGILRVTIHNHPDSKTIIKDLVVLKFDLGFGQFYNYERVCPFYLTTTK